MYEGRLPYALAAEDYNLSLKTVCHVGEIVVVGKVCLVGGVSRFYWGGRAREVACSYCLGSAWWLTTKGSDCQISFMARGDERVAGSKSQSHEQRRRNLCACSLSQAEQYSG